MQPTRKSARIASRPTTSVKITSLPVVPTPVTVRQPSARLAMQKRPNYAEPEEWEVEDPIYSSNTTLRKSSELTETDLEKFCMEYEQCGHAFSLSVGTFRDRVVGFGILSKMEILFTMFPTNRRTVRRMIHETEELFRELRELVHPDVAVSLQEVLDAMKNMFANAHRSPFFVAAN